MCRLAYIPKYINNFDFLEELFTMLNEKLGGDGMGLGWFEGDNPIIYKGVDLKPSDIINQMKNSNPNIGWLFHCRAASVGEVNYDNTHPYLCSDKIIAHNGHLSGIGVLKLLMIENLDKYEKEGWTYEKIYNTTDSNIIAYFICKYGFDITNILNAGTIISMEKDKVNIFVNELQSINNKNNIIFASEFDIEDGKSSDEWILYNPSTIIIAKENNIEINGICYNAKKIFKGKKK